MPAQIFGAQAAVSFLNRAFTNTSPSNAVYVNQVANATASLPAGTDATVAGNYTGFAKTFGTAYAGQTAAQLSTLLMTNLGLLPNAALETALADYIAAAGTGNVGIVALQLASLLSAKEGDANYGAPATAWNNEVTASFTYSSNPSNTTPSPVEVPADQGPLATAATAANAAAVAAGATAATDAAALTTALAAQTAANTTAAATDAAALAVVSTASAAAATAAVTANTAAQATLTAANASLAAAIAANPTVTADVNNANAAVIVATSKAATAAALVTSTAATAATDLAATTAATAADTAAATAATAATAALATATASSAAATTAATAATAAAAALKAATDASPVTSDDAAGAAAVTTAAATAAGIAATAATVAAAATAAAEAVKDATAASALTAYNAAAAAATTAAATATAANAAYDTAAAAVTSLDLANAAVALAATSTTAAAAAKTAADAQVAAAATLATATAATASTADNAGSAAASAAATAAATAAAAAVTAAAADATAAAAVPAQFAPQTFTLTANVENVNGTSGNDTIIAGEGSAGGVHTLGASDVINGGAGTDLIDIISNAGTTLVPRITSVEKVQDQSLAAHTLNMVNATGTTEIWSNNSTAALTVTNVGEKALIGAKGGNSSALTVQANAAAITGDLAISLDKAKVGALTVNSTGTVGTSGYASTTINAVAGTGTDRNTVTSLDVGNALATVKVIGDGALTVAADLAATVRTIDASANKGGANLSITNNTGNTTFTGGEGADRINFGGTLNLNDKVDGGAARDALAVTSQASIIAGLQVSNTEILELATLNGTLNAALIAGVDEVQVTTALDDTLGGGVAIVNGLTSNSTFVTNDSGDVRLNITNAQVAGTADTLNLKSGIAGVGSVRVMAAGVETVAYTQNNLANAGANTTLSFYDTDGLIDVETLTLTNTTGNTVNANGLVNSIKTVDASTAQGNVFLSVAGGNATNGVTLKGGAGSDGIMGGDGKDVINAGAGNDTVVSGDIFTTITGTGGVATAQQSTITIANAEVGDVFTINGNAVTWTGVEATDNAAVIAAAATAGVTVAADTAAVGTSGTFTMTGAATGAAFALPTVAATNVAAKPEVSTVTINNASVYDAGDVVSVTIAGTTFSHTATAGQTANQIATALVAQINGVVSGNSMTAVAPANVITLTGANATTNYAVSAATTNVNGGAQTQTAQVTTLTLGGTADVADNFSVNVNGTVYQGATTAALAAAIGTAGGTIASAVATSATVVTLTGLANGTAFTAAAGPTTNQPAVAGTATINFTAVANWDAGDAYAVTIDGTAVNTGPLAADGNATATGAAFVAAFYGTGLPAAGYSAVNNAGVVTVTGPAVGSDVVLSAETNTQKAAVAQVQSITFTDADWTDNGVAGALSVTVGAQTFVQTVAAATEAGGEAAVNAIVNQINLANLGVTAAAVNGAGNNSIAGLTLTANVAGTPFTASGAQAGAAATAPAVGGSVTTPNDTVTANVIAAVDNNNHRGVGTADQTLTVVTPTPAVATTTVANANPVVVDNTFTPAGATTQTIAAATTVNPQASATQYIAGAATSDTLTGGDGNDTFWFISGSNGLGGTTFTTMDTITDLNLGGATGVLAVDKVNLSNAVFGAFGATDLINAGTALSMTGATLAAGVQALFNAGGALSGSLNDVGLFTYGSDTYLIATDTVAGLNGNDVIIKVTGVTGTLDLSDIQVL